MKKNTQNWKKNKLTIIFTGLLLLSNYLSVYPQITITKVDATICGFADGSATASVSHATPTISYHWSNGAVGATASNLKAGKYTVSVTDAHGCKGTKSVQINNTAKMKVSLDGESTVPFCVNDGPPTIILTASVTGGTPPLTFSPSQAQTVQQSGKYGVIVTDVTGCSGSASLLVTFVPIRCARDPNEILGPAGYGSARYVTTHNVLNYVINFENDPKIATAPAQKVQVTHEFDTHMSIFSLRLGDFGFGNLVFHVPANSSSYNTRLDVRDSLGVYVDVTAGINVGNHTAFWILQSIDPATGLPPENPMLGFLPIDDSITHHGEGFVSFSVRPKNTTQTGDSLKASASIVFDVNPPLSTNTWVNIADAVSPVSHIDALPSSVDSTSINLSVEASDDPGGSGVQTIDIYSSANGQPYQKAGEVRPDTVFRFSGIACTEYRFFSIAKDNVGNTEAMKTVSEAVTVLKPTPVLTAQPADANISENQNATFSLTANGASVYSWEMSQDGGMTFIPLSDTLPYSGIHTQELGISAAPISINGSKYRCMVSNGYCFLYSQVVTLYINSTLAGQITYNNSMGSPMSNTRVLLKNLQGQVIDSTYTNQSGTYLFPETDPGTYIVSEHISKPWGGANAADALMAIRYFVGLDSLRSLRLKAADVNANHVINSVDALLIAKRFVGMLTSFPSGDWYTETDTVQLGNGSKVRNFITICYGDVNGSYIPGLKTSPAVNLEQRDLKKIKAGEGFQLPFVVNKDMIVGAVSLQVNFPSGYVEVVGVSLKTITATEEMVYTIDEGLLRIAWYSLSSMFVEQGEALLTLKLKAKDRPLEGSLEFSLGNNSEINDNRAEIIPGATLYLPKLVSEEQPTDYNLSQNYPNPFRQNTEISYFLPSGSYVSLKVYNSIGEMIKVLIDQDQPAGYHKVSFDGSGLSSGVYPYKIEIKAAGRDISKFRLMSLTK